MSVLLKMDLLILIAAAFNACNKGYKPTSSFLFLAAVIHQLLYWILSWVVPGGIIYKLAFIG